MNSPLRRASRTYESFSSAATLGRQYPLTRVNVSARLTLLLTCASVTVSRLAMPAMSRTAFFSCIVVPPCLRLSVSPYPLTAVPLACRAISTVARGAGNDLNRVAMVEGAEEGTPDPRKTQVKCAKSAHLATRVHLWPSRLRQL